MKAAPIYIPGVKHYMQFLNSLCCSHLKDFANAHSLKCNSILGCLVHTYLHIKTQPNFPFLNIGLLETPETLFKIYDVLSRILCDFYGLKLLHSTVFTHLTFLFPFCSFLKFCQADFLGESVFLANIHDSLDVINDRLIMATSHACNRYFNK